MNSGNFVFGLMLWFATGNVIAPPALWLLSAALAALMDHGEPLAKQRLTHRARRHHPATVGDGKFRSFGAQDRIDHVVVLGEDEKARWHVGEDESPTVRFRSMSRSWRRTAT